ncbi:MAG: PTS sugar transporter subunit IIA [Spirochaeta sp.]|nr:PTS sugar transporter subunit IIA [Spirochaeta sp.]
MVSLLSYISTDRIVDIDSQQREEILKQLIAKTLEGEASGLQDKVYKEITSKSHKKEVNMGKGFALAHARIEGIEDIRVSVGLLPNKIKYRKGDPVHTIFCIAIPNDMSRVYLSLMARLTRMLSLPDAGPKFEKANHVEIVSFIEEFEK